MSYSQSLIVSLLQTFIKAIAAESSGYLQVLPHQELNSDVLASVIIKDKIGKICYLLESDQEIHHALIISYNDKKVHCNYIYVNEETFSLETLLSCFERARIKPIFTKNPLKLHSSNKAIGFTEALYQLLTQEKITTIDIQGAVAKHHQICQRLAATQLVNFKDEAKQLGKLFRLFYLYSNLVTLLNAEKLTLLEYNKEKSNFYKIKNSDITCYLKPLAYEILFATINALSSHDLLVFLRKKCQEYLKNLLQAEQKKFPTATIPQKLIEILKIFYHTSAINIYGELAVQLPNLAQQLVTDRSALLSNRTVVKKITIAQLLKMMGMLAGGYALINSGPYYIAKPLISYYTSQKIAMYLPAERFNDETAEVIAPYLNYPLDAANCYLVISNLLLLLEAFCSEDARAPIYAGLAIAVNLLFNSLIKRFLPVAPAERMTIFMIISLFSHLLANTVAGYAYQVADNQTACGEASEQFKEAIDGQTVAIETSCSSPWMPNFFTANKKLNVLVTNKTGHTSEFECNVHNGEQKLSNCEVTQEYGKLLMPST